MSLVAALLLPLGLAACEEQGSSTSNRHWVQIPPATQALMTQKGMTRYDPILIRSFKKESELEVWKQGRDGRYALLKTYPMCRWSGQLGPKVREGDRQAPEGFYDITPAQMNPNSSYFLSFNMGFPNAFDRSHGRNGSHLMVHGACSSRGCYSMTDEQIAEIYALVRDAHSGGQKAVQMQALPFRMTPENMAKHRVDPNIAFWRNLKEGNDHFEVTKAEPKVQVCGRRYVFNAEAPGGGRLDPGGACPTLETDPQIAQAVAQKQREDQQKVAELVARGTPALKVVYEDGDQHASFKQALVTQSGDGDRATSPVVEMRSAVAEVSRPEAIAAGPRLVPLDESGRPKPEPRPVVAAAPAPAAAPVAAPAANVTVATARQPAVVAPSPAAQPATPAPVAASATPVAAASADTPFYKRLFSPIGNLFGGEAKVEPAALEAVPAPPARPGASTKPQAQAKPAGGQVSLLAPTR
jgi:murein L,D-transpeptidase YafK